MLWVGVQSDLVTQECGCLVGNDGKTVLPNNRRNLIVKANRLIRKQA